MAAASQDTWTQPVRSARYSRAAAIRPSSSRPAASRARTSARAAAPASSRRESGSSSLTTRSSGGPCRGQSESGPAKMRRAGGASASRYQGPNGPPGQAAGSNAAPPVVSWGPAPDSSCHPVMTPSTTCTKPPVTMATLYVPVGPSPPRGNPTRSPTCRYRSPFPHSFTCSYRSPSCTVSRLPTGAILRCAAPRAWDAPGTHSDRVSGRSGSAPPHRATPECPSGRRRSRLTGVGPQVLPPTAGREQLEPGAPGAAGRAPPCGVGRSRTAGGPDEGTRWHPRSTRPPMIRTLRDGGCASPRRRSPPAGGRTAMAGDGGLVPPGTPDDVREQARQEPRAPQSDPTLGIDVAPRDRRGTPPNRLVVLGDSLSQGFQSGAVYTTDLSWPAVVAHEMGWSGAFRHPVYGGPGGLPLNIELLLRRLEERFGTRFSIWEIPLALFAARGFMDEVEDYWERGPGRFTPNVNRYNHALAVYGWDLRDALSRTAATEQAAIHRPHDALIDQIVENARERAALRVYPHWDEQVIDQTLLDAAAP